VIDAGGEGGIRNPRVEHSLFEKVRYRLNPLKYAVGKHSQNLVDTNGRYQYCYHYIQRQQLIRYAPQECQFAPSVFPI
jgi:hypothetical protein